jgi:hypothetical protein
MRDIIAYSDLRINYDVDFDLVTITGADKDDVEVSVESGRGIVIKFFSAPDYEAPDDEGENNVYEFTVQDYYTSIDFVVTINDVDVL